MTTISKQTFLKSVNVGTPEQLLAHAKGKTQGHPEQARILTELGAILAIADQNKSGLVGDGRGEIPVSLWAAIDKHDKNGNAGSVTQGKGLAYELAWALMADDSQTRVASIATNIIGSAEGKKWGQETGDLAPVYNPIYSGGGWNAAGNAKSPPQLNGNWKCSVFVSEMLFRARFEPPYSSYNFTAGMGASSRHYEMACLFHTHTKYANGQAPVFKSVDSLDNLLPGDIVTFQRWGGTKWNTHGDGGHVMVVTSVDKGKVQIAEASASEARFNDLTKRLTGESGFSSATDAASALAQTQKGSDTYGTFFEMPQGVRVRFLRPIRRL